MLNCLLNIYVLASNLSTQPDPAYASPGSNIVNLFDPPLYITYPAFQIQPKSHIQCSCLVCPPLPDPKPAPKLLPGPALTGLQSIGPSHPHPIFSPSQIQSYPPDLNREAHPAKQFIPLCPSNLIPSKPFPTSRTNPPPHLLFFHNLRCLYSTQHQQKKFTSPYLIGKMQTI